MRTRASWMLGLLLVVLSGRGSTPPSPQFRYTEGHSGQAELRYRNDAPVLCLAGKPDEMGRQAAALIGPAAKGLLDYPKTLLRRFGAEDRWPELLRISRDLASQTDDAFNPRAGKGR